MKESDIMPNDDFFNYLVATDQLDDFLGYKGNDDKDLNEELENSDLENWQKEEVKKGNYNPWNFEEEDDYYSCQFLFCLIL